MLPNVSPLLVAVLIFLLQIHLGDCIKCYQCNTFLDPACADIQKEHTWSKYYLDCNVTQPLGEPIFCRKLIQTVKRPEGDHIRLIRKCGWEKSRKECYRVNDDDHSEIVCQCFEDGCNTAPTTSAWLAVPFTILSTLLFRH